MNKALSKRLLIAGIALLTVPATVLAQKEKEKEKEKDKKTAEIQTIVITRNANLDEKTVIEIDGDKVKVNGKDASDSKDVHVNVNTVKGANVYRMNNMRNGAWSMDMNNDHLSLFSEDENRAMLGVVTEGNDKGAEIQSITRESGAEKAGLKKGDVITKIDDKEIESTDDVTEAIRAHKPGEKVNITYLRDDKEQKVTAELGKWKGIKMNAVTAPRFDMGQLNMTMPEGPVFNGTWSTTGRPKLGLSIQDTDDGEGVKVMEVDEDSNAAKAGLEEDDVIVGIDDNDIKGTEDVTRILRQKDKYNFTFKIKRDGKTKNIEVKMPRKLKTADL